MKKRKSIFKGDKGRKIYYYSPYVFSFIDSRIEISEKGVAFYECELEVPPLEKGERFYINELDATYTIGDKARSVDGELVYYVEEYIEIIEDEKTEDSLKEAEYKKVEHKEKIEKDKIKKDKKWYEFWK